MFSDFWVAVSKRVGTKSWRQCKARYTEEDKLKQQTDRKMRATRRSEGELIVPISVTYSLIMMCGVGYTHITCSYAYISAISASGVANFTSI